MTTDMLERRVIKARVVSTPTDGRGTFDFEVHPFEVDLDNERIKNFVNVGPGKRASVPLDYQHTTDEVDPGGTIGTAGVAQKSESLQGTARLDIESNPMAMAVYERLLLPEDDPLRLSEVSIFYAFEPSKAFKGDKGELVQVDCELLGLAVVHRGAQRTAITNVKSTEPTSNTLGTAPVVNWANEAEVRAHYENRVPVAEDVKITITTQYPRAEKAGRVLSQKNEGKLRQALDLLSQVIESVGTTSTEEASQKEAANAKEPETANAEEPPAENEVDTVRAQWAELLAR